MSTLLPSTNENLFSNQMAGKSLGKPLQAAPADKRKAFGDLTNKAAQNISTNDLTKKAGLLASSTLSGLGGLSGAQRSNSVSSLGVSRIPSVKSSAPDAKLLTRSNSLLATSSQIPIPVPGPSKAPLLPQAHGIGLTRQTSKSVLAPEMPVVAPVPIQQKRESDNVADMDVEMDDVPDDENSVAEMHPVDQSETSVPVLDMAPVSEVRDPFATARPFWPEEEYMPMIWEHLRRSEVAKAPNPQYMQRQTDLNTRMREILIDWMIDVHMSFELHQETLFLALNILDRFLCKNQVARTKLQLVGCTALFIASKYEEMRTPEVKDFAYMTDNAYTTDQILDMEKSILAALEFHITVPSFLRFMEIYFVPFRKGSEPYHELGHLANFILELSLPYYFLVKYLPSQVAASALYLAMRFKGASWDETLVRQTRYTEEELMPCIKEMYAAFNSSASSKYQAVKRKYSGASYARIARAKLPQLPL